MSPVSDSSRRLARLTQILNDGSARTGAAATNAVGLHLGSVRLDRIQRLSTEVGERVGHETDDLDYVAMRLLLNEYAAAVAHLRAVANESASRLDGAATAFKSVRRSAHQRLKKKRR